MSRRKQLRPFKVQDDDDDDDDASKAKQTKSADNGLSTTSNGDSTSEAQSSPKSSKFDFLSNLFQWLRLQIILFL